MPDEVTPRPESEPERSLAHSPQGPSLPQADQVPPQEFFQQFIDLQKGDQDNRRRELELEHSKQQNAFSYAKESLSRQADFYMQEGTLRDGRYKVSVTVAGCLILASFVLLGVLALTGHEQIVMEVLKDAGIFLGGGGSGYVLAKRKSSQSQSQAPSGENPPTESGE